MEKIELNGSYHENMDCPKCKTGKLVTTKMDGTILEYECMECDFRGKAYDSLAIALGWE